MVVVWTTRRTTTGLPHRSSCGLAANVNLTPTVSNLPAVTVSGRGGYGTIDVDTSQWPNCSYTVVLKTCPGLTTGLLDDPGTNSTLTFAICDH